MSNQEIMFFINEAKKICLKNFCCNHSKFSVGAALLTKDKKIYTGFNIENDGIQSICAERSAFIKALTENNKEFVCIAIIGKPTDTRDFIKTVPCGYCRQFMNEYTNKDFMIYTYDELEDKIYKYTLEELLPNSFEY